MPDAPSTQDPAAQAGSSRHAAFEVSGFTGAYTILNGTYRWTSADGGVWEMEGDAANILYHDTLYTSGGDADEFHVERIADGNLGVHAIASSASIYDPSLVSYTVQSPATGSPAVALAASDTQSPTSAATPDGVRNLALVTTGFTGDAANLNSRWTTELGGSGDPYHQDAGDGDNYFTYVADEGKWKIYAEEDVTTAEFKAEMASADPTDPRGTYTGVNDQAGDTVTVATAPPSTQTP